MQCIRSKSDLGCGWFVCVFHCFQRPCALPQMVHAPETLVLVVAQQTCGLYVSTFDKTFGICVSRSYEDVFDVRQVRSSGHSVARSTLSALSCSDPTRFFESIQFFCTLLAS